VIPNPYNGNLYFEQINFQYIDAGGTAHPIQVQTTQAQGQDGCGVSNVLSATAIDGSGYSATITTYNYGGGGTVMGGVTVYGVDGTTYSFTLNGNWTSLWNWTTYPSYKTDRNGNRISLNWYPTGGPLCYHNAPACAVVTDTLGQAALTYNYDSNIPSQFTSAGQGTGKITTITYSSPAGPVDVAISYATYTLATAFGCPLMPNGWPVLEGVSPEQYFPTTITYPDGTYYQFTWQPSSSGSYTGRPLSLTLPTGGTISYSYPGPNNGIDCFDGTNMSLTRTTSDGTLQYTRTFTYPSATGTTTITDPAGNQTVITFPSLLAASLSVNPLEGLRQVYQGAASNGALLETVTTCYNGLSKCTSAGPPITRKTITTQKGSLAAAKSDVFYTITGLITEDDKYDYGGTSGRSLREPSCALKAA